MNYPQAC